MRLVIDHVLSAIEICVYNLRQLSEGMSDSKMKGLVCTEPSCELKKKKQEKYKSVTALTKLSPLEIIQMLYSL